MKISLFIPCFVDAFYPQTGACVVRVLERLGHKIHYPMELSCCGQPAFNSGYWDESRSVATGVLRMFENSDAVVIAFENNLAIGISALDPRIASTTIDEARSEFDAGVTGSVRAGRNTQHIVTDTGALGLGWRVSDWT